MWVPSSEQQVLSGMEPFFVFGIVFYDAAAVRDKGGADEMTVVRLQQQKEVRRYDY